MHLLLWVGTITILELCLARAQELETQEQADEAAAAVLNHARTAALPYRVQHLLQKPGVHPMRILPVSMTACCTLLVTA